MISHFSQTSYATARALADEVTVNPGAYAKTNSFSEYKEACACDLENLNRPPNSNAAMVHIDEDIVEADTYLRALERDRDRFPEVSPVYVKVEEQPTKAWYEKLDGAIYTVLGLFAIFIPMILVSALFAEIDMDFFRDKGSAASLISILAAAGAIAVAALRETFQFEAQKYYDRTVFALTIVGFVTFLWVSSSVALNGGGSLISGGGLNEGNVIFCAGILDFLAGGTLYIAKVRIFSVRCDVVYEEHSARKTLKPIIEAAKSKVDALKAERAEMIDANEAWRNRQALALSILCERFELAQAQYHAAEAAALLSVLERRSTNEAGSHAIATSSSTQPNGAH